MAIPPLQNVGEGEVEDANGDPPLQNVGEGKVKDVKVGGEAPC
jgi:hypothetical protein